MLTLQNRVAVSDDVIFRALGEESVILSLDTGMYFGLDPVGTRIWTLLPDRDLAQVAEVIHEEFEADLAQIQRDVLDLLEQLVAKRLVHTLPAPSAP
jgi:coenzyme PQQ synthesis protein D (PqqD)